MIGQKKDNDLVFFSGSMSELRLADFFKKVKINNKMLGSNYSSKITIRKIDVEKNIEEYEVNSFELATFDELKSINNANSIKLLKSQKCK